MFDLENVFVTAKHLRIQSKLYQFGSIDTTHGVFFSSGYKGQCKFGFLKARQSPSIVEWGVYKSAAKKVVNRISSK